ncbi:hypothetical protein Wildcat_60 [Mycobacterium phage Wildcat]|uniref:Uncharacterized protein n=3 Tax=Mycobacterium virus Wildcat TaxID=1993859 RepID=Q19Y00_9CAUD|nr:hypothetical protein Wildcat_60 [Mycobacterium phage Wildcat]ABE67665.1 hypothetical protein Wildcat_60 [Mycobacterium phage Wildcat]AQT25732.1 hypothetical protein EniyanLRS_57 [Mycobacterium phage EniyanLRS]QGJ89950.1 hypothetical protein PBI_MARYV_60 [Mycobacterium phage MaryV]
MLNFAGQQIARNDFIGQVARTNQGLRRRIGVVLGDTMGEYKGQPQPQLRVIWAEYDQTTKRWDISNGVVAPENVFKLEPSTLPPTTVRGLKIAAARGYA